MKAVHVRPAEADVFIMRPLCQANSVPMVGRGAPRGRTRQGLGRYHEVPKDLPIFMRSPFPSPRGCRPGWMEAGWEMKGADASTALPGKLTHGLDAKTP